MYKSIFFVIPFLFLGTDNIISPSVVFQDSNPTDIPIYDFHMLEPLLYTKSNKTYIINFWAMWCAPCVKELPVFEQYQKEKPDVEVLLISLDFPKNIETKLKPFLKKRGITTKVILLDDPDANNWINKIDPNWSGAIPFIIIFNKKERAFYQHTFENITELDTEINKVIKQWKL